MAFVVKTATTLRTHWKKSTFGFMVTAYGIYYVNERHKENLMRRVYCEEAKRYGDSKIQLGHIPRRVTVFLNPAASGGKARKLFEKTAAPILYLAGMEVNVVATEYEGQVKSFMAVLDTKDTDAVVVAGGDGTLLEAVTGFLRKENKTFKENIPIGVIPIGSTNRFSRLWFGGDLSEVKIIAEAAIAVVRAVTKKADVIKFDGGDGNVTYALCGLEAGAYRDAEQRKAKYWYFGPLKSRWTYLRTAMKNWPPSLKASISYLEANEENMAYGDDVEEMDKKRPTQQWSFFNFLFGRKQPSAKLEDEANAKQHEEEVKQTVTQEVSTTEMTITTTALLDPLAHPTALRVSLGPGDPSQTQLISEGWSRIKKSGFFMGSPEDQELVVKKIHIEPKNPDDWFNIDGEAFEAMPVDVSLLKNKLNMFCRQPAS